MSNSGAPQQEPRGELPPRTPPLTPEPTEEQLPSRPVSRARLEQFVAAFSPAFPARDPLVEKLDGDHLQKLISLTENQNKRSHEESKLRINRATLIALVVILAICFLCWLFLYFNKPEFVTQIISHLVAIAGGFGAGFGFGKWAKAGATPD